MVDGKRGTVDHSGDVFSIANVITVLRLALVPFAFYFLVTGPHAPSGQRNDVAFALFTLAAATDWLDGLIARRTGTVTNIGRIIDPLVDRTLIASALLGLLVAGRAQLWFVVLLIGRDVYLLYGALVLERHGRRVDVTGLGKATTAVLMVGFASLVWNAPRLVLPLMVDVSLPGGNLLVGGTRPIGAYIVYAGALMSVASAVHYTGIARRELREAIAEERGAGEGGS